MVMALPDDQRETTPYPPGQREQGDCYGRILPRLSNAPFPRAAIHYAPGNTFTLTNLDTGDVSIQIDKQVSVGYGLFPQTVIGTVLNGPEHVKGKTLLFKFYDPLYLNPDDVFTQSPRRLELKRPASAQPGISDTSTLATSGILTRKALEKISIPSSQVPHNLDQPQASASISPDAREIHEALDITPEDSATFSPVENLLTMFRTEGEALETAEVEQVERGMYWSRRDLNIMTGCKRNDVAIPIMRCEPRNVFALRAYAAEIRAYTLLERQQGDGIPKFFGNYALECSSREVQSDRIVWVNALGYSATELELAYGVSVLLTEDQRAKIKANGTNIVKTAFNANVFFPGLYMSNFLVDCASTKVKLTGFEITFDPRSHGMGVENRNSSSKNALLEVADLFTDLGF